MSEKCKWCGQEHEVPTCPAIKSIEYFQDGTVKKVEFKTAADLYPLHLAPVCYPVYVPAPYYVGPVTVPVQPYITCQTTNISHTGAYYG